MPQHTRKGKPEKHYEEGRQPRHKPYKRQEARRSVAKFNSNARFSAKDLEGYYDE